MSVGVVRRPAPAAPAAPPAAGRFPRRLELGAAAALALGAVLLWALAPTYPNYDSYYHLVWGRELLDGLEPSFEAYAAPTQHPLYVALGALLGLIGEDGDRALVLVCLLCHAALVFGTYRLGAAVFGRWPGLLAAAFVGASASFLLYAVRAYVDAPFLALVVWAGVLEAERNGSRGGPALLARAAAAGRPRSPAEPLPPEPPVGRPGLRVHEDWRRFAAPMGLLVLAGLLRPEAWVLAALYWLWAVRRATPAARLGLTAAALAAPLIWAAIDLAATGDPLHSVHATSELADDLDRERGLGEVPGSFVRFIADTVRIPVALLALPGAVLAVRRLGWEATRVPLALFAAGVTTFVGTGILGLSILPRYLTVPAVALCLFAGYGLAGFTTLPGADPLRRLWIRASIAAVVIGAAGLAVLAPSLSNVSSELRFIRGSHDALVSLLDDSRVRARMACGPLTFPNYRLVPDARWHLDVPRERIGARSARRRPYGVAVFALTPKGLRRFGFADGASPTTNIPDSGYLPLARNDRFSAFARCR